MPQTNRQWKLARRPVGMVDESNFEYAETPVPDVGPGEILVRNTMLSFEPAMRGWIEDKPSYLPPVGIGEVMRASAAGQVVTSEHPDFPVGTKVQGLLGWQDYALVDVGAGFAPTRLPEGVTDEQALSLFGGTTLTAYFGLFGVGEPKPGETVVVSGAAGATGSAVAQMARIKGCRVIGIAGGAEKCRWLEDVAKVHGTIDYKSEDVGARVAALCPDGVNVFFDNVGGEILEQVLEQMADFSRIVLCGAISGYNLEDSPPGPRNLRHLITRRIKMQGFILLDHLAQMGEALQEIGPWAASGDLVVATDVQEGMANVPSTFLRLFRGENLGKQLLRLDEP